MTAASATPNPAAFGKPSRSIACIHFGTDLSSRSRHCLTASTTSSAPRATLIHDTDPLEPPASEVSNAPDNSVTMPVAAKIPATQPIPKPVLALPAFADSSIRIAATMGIGEIATPTASGRNSPMIVPMEAH